MSDAFIGQIILFGGNFAPRSWAFCQGQLQNIASNTALFSLLGTTYGGDGRTTFGLPDTLARTALHPGRGPGLTPRTLGQKSGAIASTLSVPTMPSHSHTATATGVKVNDAAGDQGNPVGHYLSPPQSGRSRIYSNTAPSGVNMGQDAVSVTVANAGVAGPQSFNIEQPFLGVYYIICLQGVYPSRS